MGREEPHRPAYKWVALSNTTLGILMATVNSSIVLISLPAIFRGVQIDPLAPQNVSYLLWMLMGYMVVTAVLVVSLGRVGDMFGRVRMYNLGFAVFTAASIALSLVLWSGPSAALALIGLRVVQGVGGALLMANSAAILTDAFPENERGMALGINSVAGIAGSFIGLVVGGLLSAVNWHLVFLVSVPIGLFGTVWAYLKLREVGRPRRARMDWWGNVTFGVGLVLVLVGITYGIQPYGSSPMGWGNPTVLGEIGGGIALLIVFCVVETRVAEPMFRLDLFRIPAFAAGNLAGLLAAIGRGGLMFMLIIWLQGIWLPLHGYSFESTPLWAAIYMLPMTAGFLIAGPLSGYLSDRYGARPFATGGMIAAALTFGLMLTLPADFAYAPFAALLLGNGLAMGLFSSPNTAGIMNAVPAEHRGVASGMRATFQNAGMNLSIGLFFSLMIAGLSGSLPHTLGGALAAQHVPEPAASQIAGLPPVGSLFAAFLGYNPMGSLLATTHVTLPPANAAYVTGNTFFPHVISQPFIDGMHITFTFSLVMMLVAAAASWMRGGKYVHGMAPTPAVATAPARRPVTVALSAAYGAAGREIGEDVARRLGVPFQDRAVPASVKAGLAQQLDGDGDGAGAEHGFSRALAAAALASPLYGVGAPQGRVDGEVLLRDRVEAAIGRIVATTGGVILGHGATALLSADPGVLRVRLSGDEGRRIDRAMARQHIDEAEARRRLAASDRAEQTWMEHLFGTDPRDPSLYHLNLDTTVVPVPEAVDAIVAAARALHGEEPAGVAATPR